MKFEILDGYAPADLPEPNASLLALLSDLHEQVCMFPANDQLSRDILNDLRLRLELLGLIVSKSV